MERPAILRNIGLIAFCASYGEPIGLQECTGTDGTKFNALVFNDPLRDTDTMVSISSKLPQAPTLEYLAQNAKNLQVVELQPDAATIARRQERAANGQRTQMESYVLCPKGEGGTRTLFKGSLMSMLGLR